MSAYKQVQIHHFSGTGNSYRVAEWCAEMATAEADVHFAPMAVEQIHQLPSGPKSLLMLALPTHGFTSPWQTIRFVLHLPRGRGTHAAIVATRAGMKIGPVFTPGLDGTAAYFLALLLFLKCYRIRGAIGIDMPSNWITLHPGFSRESAKAIIERSRPKAERFFRRILDGRRFYGSWISFPLGLLLAPISFGYLLLGRFFLAKLFFANERCTGCGLCAQQCPVGAICMWGSEKPLPYWTYSCESCMRCMNFCPEQAVEASHSLAAILYFLVYGAVPAWSANRLIELWPWFGTAAPASVFSGWVLFYVYYLFSLFLVYVVFMVLLRLPIINKLIAYTTLTRWYRRYREPDTKVTVMKRNSEQLGGKATSN